MSNINNLSGEVQLWLVTVFMMAVPLYFLVAVAPLRGQEAEALIRLTVTCFLLFSLHRGRKWAGPVLAFFALTGAVYLNVRLGFFRDGLSDRTIIELAVKDAGYTACGLLLVFSKKLRDHITSRRQVQ